VRINEVLLTLHILASAVWIGAAVALQVIAARVRPSTPDAVVNEFAVDAEAIGKAIFGPAAVVLLVTGAALVQRQHLGWTPGFCWASARWWSPEPSAGRSSSRRGAVSPSSPVIPGMIPLSSAIGRGADSSSLESTS